MADVFYEVSHEDLLEEILDAYMTKEPLFVWGRTGIGKSYTVREASRKLAEKFNRKYSERPEDADGEHFVLVDRRLAQMEPTDLLGVLYKDNGVSRWHYPDWLVRLSKQWEEQQGVEVKGILFFDELNLAPQIVQNACFLEGTLIATKSGYKDIKDIKAGDYVISDDGRPHRVTRVFKREYRGEIVTIKATNTLPIKVTVDHPILSSNRKYRNGIPEFSKPTWKAAGELKVGDMVFLPKLRGFVRAKEINLSPYISSLFPPKAKVTLDLDYKLAELLGLYLAEGWSSHGSVGLAFGGHERELIDHTVELIGECFGMEASIQEGSESNVQVIFCNKPLSLALRELFGGKARAKRIPEFIMYHEDPEIVRHFLIGYFKGDGCVVKVANKRTRYVSFSTASQVLGRQLQLLLTRFGIVASIAKDEKERQSVIIENSKNGLKKRIIKSRIAYQVKSSNNDLFNLLGLEPIRKIRPTSSYWDVGDYIAVRVAGVHYHPYSGTVYNLEVEDRHTYLAENLIVHNCYSLIHERKIHELELADGVVVIAAGNVSEDRAYTFDLSDPLRTRFTHVTLKTPVFKDEDSRGGWLYWAAENGIDGRILAFLSFQPNLLFKYVENDRTFPTPRGWEKASTLMKGKPNEKAWRAVAKACGYVAGLQFRQFMELSVNVDLEEIIHNPKKLLELEMSARFSVVAALSHLYSQKPEKYAEKLLKLTAHLFTGIYDDRIMDHVRLAEQCEKLSGEELREAKKKMREIEGNREPELAALVLTNMKAANRDEFAKALRSSRYATAVTDLVYYLI